MRYYSDKLDEIFDTPEELSKAEKDRAEQLRIRREEETKAKQKVKDISTKYTDLIHEKHEINKQIETARQDLDKALEEYNDKFGPYLIYTSEEDCDDEDYKNDLYDPWDSMTIFKHIFDF